MDTKQTIDPGPCMAPATDIVSTQEFMIQRNLLMFMLEMNVIDIDGAIEQLTSDFDGLTAAAALDQLLPEEAIEALAEFHDLLGTPMPEAG